MAGFPTRNLRSSVLGPRSSVRLHLVRIVVVVLLLSPSTLLSDQADPRASETSASFTVLVGGVPIGKEQVTMSSTAQERILSGSGRLAPPVDVVINRFEVRYDSSWRPLRLTFAGAVRGERQSLHTTFEGGTATSQIVVGDKSTSKSDAVAPDTVVLVNGAFGTYEALAARLHASQPGTEFRAYVVPHVEIPIRFVSSSNERIVTLGRTIAARRHKIGVVNPSGTLDADLWTDETGRLLRLFIPGQSIDVVRDDVATVSSRFERTPRPGDETIRIPVSGFSLAATVSKPKRSDTVGSSKAPAIVLVGAPGAQRDESSAGFPIFGELAGRLADGGFLVIRYDQRGVGQSGGRSEAATLADFADDLRAVVRYVAKRKDLDSKRIAVVGHGEGGWVAMIAATKDDRIAALSLLATAAIPGANLVLEQQRGVLEYMTIADEEKQSRIQLQQTILSAVRSGKGWESVPPELRRQAETPWFRSLLEFDPAPVAKDITIPVLIVQGELDREVLPYHAARLKQLIEQRKNPPTVEVARLQGVNHWLIAETSGEAVATGSIPEPHVAASVNETLLSWLRKTIQPAGSSQSTQNSSRPSLNRSPETSVASSMRRPLTNVPLVLFRSSTRSW